ncbi:MAG TPA: hypothetical protein VFR10_14160 [bacterium]|nr:hypothetical protein [bacterium]
MENKPKAAVKESKYWCNFCGLVTADEQLYLSHSCKEELRRKERLPSSDVREDHCR